MHATDIVSIMYKYTYIVSYIFLGNGEYMKLNKLASSCIQFKCCRSKPHFDMAVCDGCSITLVSQTSTSKH